MSLANIAWILASQGQRELANDWDLEAPGLHRYFHPFIDDKELAHSVGLIDFLANFVEGARHQPTTTSKDWYEPYTQIGRHAFSLNWDFPGHGTLDLLPAGRQGSAYSTRVTSFNWADFYDRLGGGVFLEAFKRNLRAEYDYILIDSRTGISDTSGICTIQMPDDLVVCFTLNMQSVWGAAAAAQSAFEQRMTPHRTSGLRIWPVPMRVELNERDRLERARDDVHARFQKFLHHLPSSERASYWGSVEVLYQPYFAYEEVLAALAERKQQTGSLLRSFESLTSYLSGGSVKELGNVDEDRRHAALNSYRDAGAGPFYLSYNHADREFADRLVMLLRAKFGRDAILWDNDLLKVGLSWVDTLASAMNEAKAVLLLLSRNYIEGGHAPQEVAYALKRGLRVIPLMQDDLSWSELSRLPEPFPSLARLHGFVFSSKPKALDKEVEQLSQILRDVALSEQSRSSKHDPDDPHRARFGGKKVNNGFAVKAKISAISDDLFEVLLTVHRPDGTHFIGEVEFHLHPTFSPSVRRVEFKHGEASLRLEAWGAFTVGVVTLDSLAMLEIDLAKERTAPAAFRMR